MIGDPLRSMEIGADLAGLEPLSRDGRGVADLLRVRVGDVRCVKKGGPVQPDIHERRLHAGQDAAYPTLVDVAHEPAPVRTLDEDFLEHAAFDQRDPGLAWSDVDQQFGAHDSVRVAGFVVRRFAEPSAVEWRSPVAAALSAILTSRSVVSSPGSAKFRPARCGGVFNRRRSGR